jgi:hypothetical protein
MTGPDKISPGATGNGSRGLSPRTSGAPARALCTPPCLLSAPAPGRDAFFLQADTTQTVRPLYVGTELARLYIA